MATIGVGVAFLGLSYFFASTGACLIGEHSAGVCFFESCSMVRPELSFFGIGIS